MPDVLTTEAEPEGFQAHGFIGDIAGEDHQIGPADAVAVFLLDRPEQTARLVEAGIVRPGVERGKALVAGAAAAATIGEAIGTGRMPCHADHEAAIMAPVGRPPFLTVGHQCMEVFFQRIDIKLLQGFTIIEVLAHGVGLGVVLMQDVEIEGIGPPARDA